MKALELKDVVMHYRLFGGAYVRAVDGVSFVVEEGKTTGIVGESGCGKSSIAGTILRTIPENGKIKGGELWFRYGETIGFDGGVDILKLSMKDMQRLRWKGISMIFQGAMNSLNPVIKVGDQIKEIILYKEGITKEEAQERVENLCSLVHIDPERMKGYPHQFSGGMKQRAIIALALATNPKLVIADEPTTALDLITQENVMKEIKELQKKLNMSMIFISHDLSRVSEISDYIVVMYAGKVVEECNKFELFRNPMHPYTKGLIDSCPNLRGEKKEIKGIPGEPPDLASPPKGCRFNPRCPYAFERCREEEPELREISDSHYVSCWGV